MAVILLDSSSKHMTQVSTFRARGSEWINHNHCLLLLIRCQVRIWEGIREDIKRIHHLDQDSLIPRIQAHRRATPSQGRINSNQAIRWL